MPGDESPDAQYERLKRQLQDAILNQYPNPERRGCPGEAVLRRLAARYLDSAVEDDPTWHHVTHCSPCYREFLDIRGEMKRAANAKQAGLRLGLAAVALAIVAAVVYFASMPDFVHPERPQIAELNYRPRLVDLSSRPVTRSGDGKGSAEPILLGREPEELTIRLPFGSEAGEYDIQILKADDAVLLSLKEAARLVDGVTSIKTKIDLSKFAPGEYKLRVRRVGSEWARHPIHIK